MITTLQKYINEMKKTSIWDILNQKNINIDDLIKYLIDGNPNTKNNNKQTPLIYCLKYNKSIAAEFLIPHSNLNIKDNNSQTALFITLQKKRFSLFKKILETGRVDLEKIVNGDEKYLDYAIKHSNRTYVSLLLMYGAKPTFDNLYDLIKNGYINSADLAIMNITKIELNKKDEDGNTLLHICDNVFLMSKLIKKGIKTNIENNKGFDFYHFLSEENGYALLNRLSDKTDKYSKKVFNKLNKKYIKKKYKI